MPTITSRRDLALSVWDHLLFQPYRWAGDDPLAGFDCSGLVIEGLKASGVLPRAGDWSAADLAQRFPVSPPLGSAPGAHPKPGDLLFWNRGTPPKIGHVEIVWAVIDGQVFTLGAAGGGSGTTSLPAAIEQNAYVMVRPAVPGWVRAVDPFSVP